MRLALACLLLLLTAAPALAQQPQYITEATGEGLEWTVKGSVGGAHAAIDGTKFKTALQGATRVSVGVGARVDDVSGGPTGESQWRLAVAPVSNTSMSCLFNGRGVIWTGLTLSSRAIWYCVWDTQQASQANRVRLYKDGVDQGDFDTGTPPSQNETLDLLTGKRLNVGNHDLTAADGESSIDGRIYFVDYWATALDATKVADRSKCLLANDDTTNCDAPTQPPPPTSVLYVGEGTWQASSTATELTPAPPAGVLATDQCFAIAASRTTGTAPIWSFPTGWAAVRSCHQAGVGGAIALAVYEKTGGAPLGSQVVQIDTPGFGWSVVILCYRNTPGEVGSALGGTATPSTTRTPVSVTTVNASTQVFTVAATPDLNQLTLQTANGFTERLAGSQWDTGAGPHAIFMADITQGAPGAVTMPVIQQGLNGPDVWCDITVALDLITTPQPPPPPQGGGPVGVERFIISDALRPMVGDSLRPMVPDTLR